MFDGFDFFDSPIGPGGGGPDEPMGFVTHLVIISLFVLLAIGLVKWLS